MASCMYPDDCPGPDGPLKNGDWLRADATKPEKASSREVPVPLFQPHVRLTRTRRDFIRDAFCGFGGLALASLLHDEELRGRPADPLSPRVPPLPAQAPPATFLFTPARPTPLEPFP